jgi:hypothetical protein
MGDSAPSLQSVTRSLKNLQGSLLGIESPGSNLIGLMTKTSEV